MSNRVTAIVACAVFGSPTTANNQVCEPITYEGATIKVCVSEADLARLRELATPRAFELSTPDANTVF